MSAACQARVRPRPVRSRGEAWCSGPALRPPHILWEHPMLDLIMLAAGLGFFALAWAYVAGCDRL
ncbi:MAG: hypothetical protein F9K29_14250 [Hyphomicrobiaceae bacterium]|nr:MAG: hypothetical protein F9K29_14250 [Hyphomicrobiaceae bacterium]